ncbi:hypothetical protein ACIOGX_36360 [Streptomyces sp. NPDC088147]
MLPLTRLHTLRRAMVCRRVRGEAGGLCATRRVSSEEDCALGVGRYDPDG